jgi:hypothetical protein
VGQVLVDVLHDEAGVGVEILVQLWAPPGVRGVLEENGVGVLWGPAGGLRGVCVLGGRHPLNRLNNNNNARAFTGFFEAGSGRARGVLGRQARSADRQHASRAHRKCLIINGLHQMDYLTHGDQVRIQGEKRPCRGRVTRPGDRCGPGCNAMAWRGAYATGDHVGKARGS